MNVWAVANQKGGVGKTTSVVALGGLLASQDQRVLLLDMDPHGSLTSYFKYNPDEIEKSIFQLFQHEGEVPEGLARQLVIRTDFKNLDFMAASTSLAILERHAVSKGGMGLVIAKTLEQLKYDYDYVLIDTPPILGVLLINAMAACQKLIMPVQTEHLAIKGLERMMRTLQMVIRSQKRNFEYTVVPTMFDRRTHASVDSLRVLRNTYEDNIWPSAISVDTKLRDASKAGTPPHIHDNSTRGVKSYRSLLKYLLSKEPSSIPADV